MTIKTNKFSQIISFSSAALFSLLISSFYSYAQQDNKNKLPEIGGAGLSVLSIDKERQIGDAMMRHLRASQPIVHDPVLTEYINDIGNRMVRHANDVNYNFKFFLINNNELNAFAFFGGHIVIHTGLLITADNESELASVIAHEISHVTQRHLARRMEAGSRNQPLTMAGMISGVLLSLVNPTVGMAALSTSMAASQQAGINYTRGNEKEADRVGIQLLANSGFDPMGAPNFFTKMSERFRYKSKPPAMLLTHPLPDSRITDARTRAQNYSPRTIAPSLTFELAKARINARYQGNPRDNIKRIKYKIAKQQYRFKAATQYGLAISYFENKQYQQAQDLLERLLKDDNNNLFYIDVLTDTLIATEQFDRAIAMLAEIEKLMPKNQVVALNYANTLIKAEKYAQAEQILQDYLLLDKSNYLANDLLTQVYRAQNNKAMMHASKAEVYALLGAFPRAVDELQTGYTFANDMPLIKKRIKARILQFQEQEQKLKRLN
ncbi:M48 family metalloprotease [Thalassotalea sp. G2M2-11]|uniref:beta-barrel assembly-enhancing protease n=1 Tax=Thalassotalea sp. G2M2-11 TaxID=2787627 RepID=UPI0019CF6B39|nr:M48 family metalloprotease [Thalassotalea sp. G2M2-11]